MAGDADRHEGRLACCDGRAVKDVAVDLGAGLEDQLAADEAGLEEDASHEAVLEQERPITPDVRRPLARVSWLARKTTCFCW